MSLYEVFLLTGSVMFGLALLVCFSAAARDVSIRKGFVMLGMGMALLVGAHQTSVDGIRPGDVGNVMAKFVSQLV
ncbi:MAG: hypothetical protein V3V13_00895 [Paracoccaceae bacterium]